MANPICNPRFEIHYDTKTGNELSFLYSFNYYPESDTTELHVIVNSQTISFDVDSTMKRRFEQNEEQVFADFPQLEQYDSTYLIKSLVFRGLRITEVEKLSGEKWKLIKVGN